MILKSDAKSKEKLTGSFKYDMRNLNSHSSTQKFEKFTSMGSFCLKYIRLELKNTEEISWWHQRVIQNWTNSDLVVSKMASRSGWTFIRGLQSLKTWTLMGCFCSKLIMFQLENFRETICHETEVKTGLRIKNEISNLVNFHVCSWNFQFDELLLSKACKYLD